MDATVTFSKEFKNKTKQVVGNVQKRELRLQRLAKAEEDGLLAKAKTRADVANLAGFTAKQKTSGYLWVYNQVKDGKLAEHIMNYLPNGKAEYEYHVIDTSSKPRKDSRAVKHIDNSTFKKVAKEEPVILSRAYEPKGQTVTLTNVHPKVTIKLAHIELVLEDMPLKDIAELVRTLDKEA